MADKKVKIYQVFFQDEREKKIKYDITEFFAELHDDFLKNQINLPQLYNDRKVYLFDYALSATGDYSEFVIPFGKLKRNPPYKKRYDNEKAITQETEELFDVNLLYYSKEYDAAILTTDKEGPNNKVIQSLLNCFVKNKAYTLRVKPILYSEGIERIEESKKVKSITISTNLDPATQEYYDRHINSDVTLFKGMLDLMSLSRNEAKNHTFKLELGMGRKKDYIDYNTVMALLNELEIADSDIFKEVTINYYNGRSEKVESIKLKKSDIELSGRIHIEHKGSIMISELIEYGKKIMENNLYRIKEANRMLNQTAVDIYDDIDICQGVKYADTEEALV